MKTAYLQKDSLFSPAFTIFNISLIIVLSLFIGVGSAVSINFILLVISWPFLMFGDFPLMFAKKRFAKFVLNFTYPTAFVFTNIVFASIIHSMLGLPKLENLSDVNPYVFSICYTVLLVFMQNLHHVLIFLSRYKRFMSFAEWGFKGNWRGTTLSEIIGKGDMNDELHIVEVKRLASGILMGVCFILNFVLVFIAIGVGALLGIINKPGFELLIYPFFFNIVLMFSALIEYMHSNRVKRFLFMERHRLWGGDSLYY